MANLETLPDLDKNSFEVLDDANFLAARRVVIYAGTVAAVPSGLRTAGKVTTLDVTTTAAVLPATALTDRNAMSVHNLSTTTTVYIGFDSGVTADAVNGTTSGWELGPGEFFNTDITDGIFLYAIVSTGTAKVKVMELS